MRKFSVYTVLFATVLLFFGCQQEIEDTNSANGIHFELFAAANDNDTKTANDGMSTVWSSGDKINVFHAVGNSVSYKSDGAFDIDDVETGHAIGNISEALEDYLSYDWYAFYPYNSKLTSPENDNIFYTAIGCKSNETQTQDGNDNMDHIAGPNCPLYGLAKLVRLPNVPTIQMHQASSLVEFTVTNGLEEPLTVTEIQFTATEDIVGTYYINFANRPETGGDIQPIYTSSGDKYVSNIATLDVTSGEPIAVGGSAKFYLAIKPFTAEADDVLNVVVSGTTDSGVSEQVKEITLTKETTFTAGKIKKVAVNYVTAPIVFVSAEYELATSVSDGDEIILASGKSGEVSVMGAYSGGNNWPAVENVTVGENGCITSVNGMAILTLTKNDDDSFSIFDTWSENYWDATSTTDKNYLKGSEDTGDYTSFEISFGSDDNAAIANTGKSSRNIVRYNSSSTLFSCYSSGQGAVYIFKKVSSDPKIVASNIYDIPAIGIEDGEASYSVKNFDDDVEVASVSGCVSEAIAVDGEIVFTVSPNYTTSTANGSIVLQSKGNPSVSTTISVTQKASVFEVVADNPVVIANTAESEGAFVVKSTFGGTLTLSDEDNFETDDVFAADEDGVTVTVAALNDGAVNDREFTVTVARTGVDPVVVNLKQANRREAVATPTIACENNTVTISCETEGASIYYTTNGSTPTTSSTAYSAPFAITENVTVKAIAVKENFNNSEVASESCVYRAALTPGTDVINQTFTGVTVTSYASWSRKTGVTGVEYSGNSAGGNSSVQLRSKENSGIVSTYGGSLYLQSVSVVWDDNTLAGRTIDVYGSNTPYGSPADLYGDNKGTLLGSIICGTSTILRVSGGYKYIGVRSRDGALYLTSISIKWGDTIPVIEPVDASWSVSPASISVEAGKTATATITTDYDGTLSVASNNESAATATISGKVITVTGKAEGTATLTVTGAATSNFNAISKTIDVTVTAAQGGGDFKKTYKYGLVGWTLSNYKDQSNYYLVPNTTDSPSVATIAGIFADKTITSDVVITLDVATYGSGSSPTSSTFSIYADSECTKAITAAQSGTLPSNSTYVNTTYTVSAENATSFDNDMSIKIIKDGRQIRLRSITVEFSYR